MGGYGAKNTPSRPANRKHDGLTVVACSYLYPKFKFKNQCHNQVQKDSYIYVEKNQGMKV